MDQIKNIVATPYQSLCKFMKNDTYGTEMLVYGTSSLMLIVAYIKRKPTYLVRQFKKPSHIPERLINERIMHTGYIRGVKQLDQETVLLIQHKPLIPLFTSRKRMLPIKLPGIKVNANGYSWIQQCLIGREATFLPLDKSKSKEDYVVCQLCLVHPPKGNQLLDVSETLLKLKFGKFLLDEASKSKQNLKYYKNLQKIETKTLNIDSWKVWLASHPYLWLKFNELKESILPKHKLLPQLVR